MIAARAAAGLRPGVPRDAARAAGAGAPGPGGLGQALAKATAENFPVALRLLPPRARRHLMAVYAFARTVDDIGDAAPPGERLGLLADVESDLRRLFGRDGAGDPPRLAAVAGLSAVVAECGVPIEPFLALIEANRRDQTVNRYQTFEDLLGYCELSANPVGRIVLRVFGVHSPERAVLSDSVCTGLQLAEHWQDVAEDFAAGRIYLPARDMLEHGCSERDLAGRRAPERLRRLIAFEVGRARSLIDAGAPLIGDLRGAARAAVAGYVAGGRAALAAIEAAGCDVLAGAPHPARRRVAAELARAWARGR